jgi:hypothetical protein
MGAIVVDVRTQNYCICGIVIATEHFMVIEDVEDISG